MYIQASNIEVIQNEDLAVVGDVLEFIHNCVINVGPFFKLESDLALPLY